MAIKGVQYVSNSYIASSHFSWTKSKITGWSIHLDFRLQSKPAFSGELKKIRDLKSHKIVLLTEN